MMVDNDQINYIKCDAPILLTDKYNRKIVYSVNYECNSEYLTKEIIVELPLMDRPKINKNIINQNNFRNGYSLVLLENGEYGYVNEKNILLDYRFDIATDFNEYGLAMVAVDGNVTWINKKFEFLSNKNNLLPIDNPNFLRNDGFQILFKFSNNKSKAFERRGLNQDYFINPNLKIYLQKQEEYSVNIDSNKKIIEYVEAEDKLIKIIRQEKKGSYLSIIAEGKDENSLMYGNLLDKLNNVTFENYDINNIWNFVYNVILNYYPKSNVSIIDEENNKLVLIQVCEQLSIVIKSGKSKTDEFIDDLIKSMNERKASEYNYGKIKILTKTIEPL